MDIAATNIGRTNAYRAIAAIAALTFAVDELTKVLARASLSLCHVPSDACQQTDLTSWFGFVRLENGGSPLGFGQGLWVWVLLALVGLLLVPVYARAGAGAGLLALAAGLQLGGAIGNLVDRAVFGGATDFIRVGVVVVNLADLALLAGALIGTWVLAHAGARSHGKGVNTR